MLTFNQYRDNPSAPIIPVHDVGAIYLIGASSLQVTMISKLRTSTGDLDWQAAAHLLWEERDWLKSGANFRWAMEAWSAGKEGDGPMRRLLGGH